ncbi:MAG: Cytochrome c-type biogenesis protein DsbD, protein-disulfide reductase [uncultured Gemmatimonadetes bacterium]|uniref:Cytochrome c-type biogenesis protein DsbD, protein-disulfide reductase n=1 Tax=uncultured Gemmatimonadota bacterium TaxID=203437 RepID=A0A6J4KMQ5_9BACT|nr:MAG: Cytochrome c-type biogenesis protein DsbD, protein-disulfide reductase [uncultured Gemmatimonadota bacterium]
MIHCRIVLALLAAALLPVPALAQSPPGPGALVPAAAGRPVEVELRSAARAVAPGDTVPVAIRLLPNRGWHTYWRHAGDVGSPPAVTWRLPDGFTAAPLRWPTPERIEAPPLASYGYEHEVHLLGAVHVPSSARVGSTAKLGATLTWVVCEVECVAGDVDVALTVPVASRTIIDEAVARAFSAEAARIPARRDGWTFRAATDSENVLLHVYPPGESEIATGRTRPRVQFFIDSAGVIDHAAQPRVRTVPAGIELQMGRSAFAAGSPSRITGVLAIDTAARAGAFAPQVTLEVDAPVVAMAQLAAAAPPTLGTAGSWVALATAGLLALLGGTLLNLMPCVLPVLSIKMLGIAEAAAHDARTARRHVVLFGTGVLVSMWALVAVLLALRAAGTQAGWGYQLQNPAVVGALALLIFAAGLNMAGVFDLVPVGGSLSAAARHAPRGVEAFLGGVLITALATPCSAPFLAAGVAYAVTAGAVESFVVFTALGLGLIWPLALVAAVPRLRTWLPKPGAWMVTLRQVLAFPLFATVVWLAWVLGRQAGVNAMVALLGACTLLSLGLWVLGRFGTIAAPTGRRRLAQVLAMASAAGALALVSGASAQGAPGAAQAGSATPGDAAEGALAWRPYSAELLEAQRDSGRIVLLDFTADWCLTCKVNERVALGSEAVGVAIRDHDVALLRADWTTRDPAVTRALASFGRNSVPFVVIYPRAREAAPILMPTLLTSGIVTGALARAAESPPGVPKSAALTSGRVVPSPSLPKATP